MPARSPVPESPSRFSRAANSRGDGGGRKNRKPSFPWRGLLAALIALLGLVAGGIVWWANSPIALRDPLVDVHIPAGSGLRAALRQLDTAGAPLPTWPMILLARLARSEASIKAGSYELRDPLTPWQLLGKLTRGDVSQGDVVLPEGWTFRQLRARIDAHPDLRHDSAGMSDQALLARIGASESHPEGLFFPDTYLFDKRSADLDVYARAYRAMQRRLKEVWTARDPGTPLKTPYEALILASIVEKETGRDADRPQVAAVFANRLRRNMLLQTDPTVIYGLGESFDGNLRKRDLIADTPYNSYTRGGLPPTPIAMAGEASLRAALNPARSNALYFVARGDGSSEFSDSLDAHNRAVNRYQKSPGGR